MANPSKDNGFTAIPNEILHVLCKLNLSAYEWRIFMALVRMTWGWNKKGCYTSFRVLAEKTAIDLRNVQRTVKSLIEKQLIFTRNSSIKTYFEIVDNYEIWKVEIGKPNLFSSEGVVSTDYGSVVSGDYTCKDKDNSIKDNIKERVVVETDEDIAALIKATKEKNGWSTNAQPVEQGCSLKLRATTRT